MKALCLVPRPPRLVRGISREAAEVMNADGGGPPDRAEVAEIMRRHGLTPAPPRPDAQRTASQARRS